MKAKRKVSKKQRWIRNLRHRLYENQGGCCCWCGEKMEPLVYRDTPPSSLGKRAPTLEHIVPAANGGRFKADNLLLAHRGCNERRATKQRRPLFVPVANSLLIEPE